jgi:DNA-binding transcriptional LysR family regulator
MKTNSHSLDLSHLSRTTPSTEALFALLAFARAGDLVGAAKTLNSSQPALSFHLKKLEEQVGVTLFAFSGKRKVLTKLGKEYALEVERMFQGYQTQSAQILKTAQNLATQTLRVAGRRELLIPVLPFPFPGSVEFILNSTQEAIVQLKNHQVDLAVSAGLPDSPDLIAKLFFDSRLKLVYHRSLKTRKGGSMIGSVEWMKRHPVTVYGNHHAYLDEFLKPKAVAFSELKVARIVEDWYSVVECVRLTQGWAIIPEAWGVHGNQLESEVLTDSQFLTKSVYLVFRRSDRKLPWVKLLETWLDSRHTKTV